MTRDETKHQIARELSTASKAAHQGNHGMVRVCARRAAGIAITFWLQNNPGIHWGLDAMTQLRAVQHDASLPAEVRDAANRLTTRVTEQFTYPPSTDPVDDARIIIHYFFGTV